MGESATLQSCRGGRNHFSLAPFNLLCRPVLVPQMAGRGEPPVTMNWSKSHLWSVASGWASTMSSMSSLGSAGGVGVGQVGIDAEVKVVSGRYFNWIGMDKELSMEREWVEVVHRF